MRQIDRQFNGKTVRIIETNNNQYFALADICKILNLKNPSKVRTRLSNESVCFFKVDYGNNSERIFVSQKGLIQTISRTRKKSADFKKKLLVTLGLDPGVVLCDSRPEEEFVSMLEIVTKQLPITLLKQKHVSKYNVDIFIPEINLVIEYDEDNHRNYCKLTERKREKEIRRLLDCELIRISDRETHLENVSIVLSKIFEIFNRRDSLESTYKSI